METSAQNEGTVLHADLDSFFASVEQRDDPALCGRPVIVGGGVVLAASYEARAHGVRGAMGGRQALRLCPDAVVVPPRMEAYSRASRDVFAVFADTTPLVEGVSIDEAFLEVGGLLRIRGAPSTIAARLRADVRERVGLPISVGVARTKYLAKVASAMAKPDGLLLVPLADERRFLHSLPVQALWGVGPKTTQKLHGARIRTIADVARLEVRELAALVGQGAARHLHTLASGEDTRRVETGRRRRSMGAQHALGHGEHALRDIEIVLAMLLDRVARRLRGAGRTASTVIVRVRFADFTASTSSRTLPRPSAHTDVLLGTAMALLHGRTAEIEQRGITLVGVQCAGLDDHGEQLELPLPGGGAGPWAADGTDSYHLDQALDAVRGRFGSRAVTRAAQVGRSVRPAMPTLPD